MHVFHRWWTHPSNFAWAAAYHRTNPLLRRAHIAVGVWCLLYAVVCVLVTHTPAGIGGPGGHAASYGLAATAGIVGVLWIRGPWPTETVSKVFVAYLEISGAAVLLMLTDPMVALPCAAALGVPGSFVAAFHSPKLFLAHQCWAIAISGALFSEAVLEPSADVVLASAYLVLLILVLFSAPILSQSLLLLLRRDAATAFFDPLTGLRNRRGIEAALDEDVPSAGGSTAAVLVIDIDDFKLVNDRHGHAHGDTILRRCAAAIDAAFPAPAISARTGGEEFAVITFTEITVAITVASRLRIALASERNTAVTVSIGIACTPVDTLAARYEQVCNRADAAMYEAKRAGGNTVVIDSSGADPRIC